MPVWLSYLASVYTAGVAGRLWIQLNMALTTCSLLYGVDEMVVLRTLSLSLFIPKGKASVLGVWTVLVRKAESLPVCPTVSIFYQMREQGGRGTRILVQCLSVGTGICSSLILSAWKSPGAAGEFLPGDEVQKRLSFLKWSPHQTAGGLSSSLTEEHIKSCKEHQIGGQDLGFWLCHLSNCTSRWGQVSLFRRLKEVLPGCCLVTPPLSL